MTARCTVKDNPGRESYWVPQMRMIQANNYTEPTMRECRVIMICTLRQNPQSITAMESGSPVREAARLRYGTSFTPVAKCLLRQVTPVRNILGQRNAFGRKVCRGFQACARNRELYQFVTDFGYSGDLTGDVPPNRLAVLGDYLMDEDVVTIMMNNFPQRTQAQMARCRNIILRYFRPDAVERIQQRLDPTFQPPRPLFPAVQAGNDGNDGNGNDGNESPPLED